MQIKDRLFQKAFARIFVYNILFEDSAVDERYLGVDDRSTVLGITGAGCGIAGLLASRPRRVDAVDINPHHLTLTALKVTASQRLRSYAHFYELCGRGHTSDGGRTIRELTGHLPPWMQRYWRRHWRRFKTSIYERGLTSRMLGHMRRQAGLDAGWLIEVARLPTDERVAAIEATLGRMLERPLVAGWMRSPMQMLALGINYSQRERLERMQGGGLLAVCMEHLRKVAATDLMTNWFAWHSAAGHFNHEDPHALPPYLRHDRHHRAFGSPTEVVYHRRNIFDVLATGTRDTWSHYTLCDAPDWLPAPLQLRLWSEIRRTARPGAVVLVRSVENVDPIARLGLEEHFRWRRSASEAATREDRSRQYARVDFYEVEA